MTDDIVSQSPHGSEDMSCNSEGILWHILGQGPAVYQSHVQGGVGNAAPLGEELGQGNSLTGRMFAVFLESNQVLLLRGTTTRRFVGHTKDVLSVAFSSDNRQIVSGSRDKTIKLWNTLGVCKYTVQVK